MFLGVGRVRRAATLQFALGISLNMLSHMRTTLDLPDPLFHQAKKLAKRRKIPFRALVAEALRKLVREDEPASAFKLKDLSLGKGGLVDGVSWSNWEQVRDLAYASHDE